MQSVPLELGMHWVAPKSTGHSRNPSMCWERDLLLRQHYLFCLQLRNEIPTDKQRCTATQQMVALSVFLKTPSSVGLDLKPETPMRSAPIVLLWLTSGKWLQHFYYLFNFTINYTSYHLIHLDSRATTKKKFSFVALQYILLIWNKSVTNY